MRNPAPVCTSPEPAEVHERVDPGAFEEANDEGSGNQLRLWQKGTRFGFTFVGYDLASSSGQASQHERHGDDTQKHEDT